MLDVYERFAEEFMAMPVIAGQKTESEKFPGAVRTYSIEAMMQDKKALQAGTSHMLGQNFAKMFDTMFQGRDGQKHYVWQTSWGVSTRLIGALIMTHSDDAGLVVPPKLAPPRTWSSSSSARRPRSARPVKEKADALAADLQEGRRVGASSTTTRPRARASSTPSTSCAGVCLRVELGPKDLEKGQCVLARRDTPEPRSFVPLDARRWPRRPGRCSTQMQKDLFAKAKAFRDANTFEVNSYDELKAKADDGFLLAHWDGTRRDRGAHQGRDRPHHPQPPVRPKQEPGTCVATRQAISGPHRLRQVVLRSEEPVPEPVLYLEPVGGIAGDMFLAAALDLGVPLDALEAPLRTLGVPGWHFAVTSATSATASAAPTSTWYVDAPERPHAHRSWRRHRRPHRAPRGLSAKAKERAR